MISAPPEESDLVALTLLTLKPASPADACKLTLISSLTASISISAWVKSVPSNSARADTPHPPISVEALPQTFLGREAMSVVGLAAASIPYSSSTSPVEVVADQLTVGSSPPISAKFPS